MNHRQYRCLFTIRHMIRIPYRYLHLLGIVLLLSVPGWAVAQDGAPEAKKPSDVRMVIDISGSMKKNDPKNLRRPALDMLVKLLPKDSKAGVWTFGQYVNMLIPHRVVDDKWAQQASASANEIRSIAQFTNIGEALEQAGYDYQSKKNDYQKHIILLTDGMVDINRNPDVNQRERQRIIDEIIPRYQQAGFTLHTIALSDNADKQLMTKLALATDGKVAVAKTAEELMNAFLQVFNQAVPAEELPFDGESFVTDSSIEEFTALIFRQPGTPATEIIAPDQERYTKDSQDSRLVWHHTEQYDLITVKQPLEGEWKVVADVEPQSQITVVSDLSLAVKTMPTNLSVRDILTTSLALREENKIVKRQEFLSVLDIDVKVSLAGNQVWSQRLSDGPPPVDGIYPITLDQFREEGQYIIDFMVDGKTFQRQFSHSLTVRQPFDIDVDKKEVSGNTQFIVQVVPLSQTINNQQTEVMGKLKKPAGTSHIVKFTPTEDGNWAFELAPEEKGKYTLGIRVTAYTEDGERLDFTPDPLTLLNQPDDSVFEQPEPIKQPEPVKQPEPIKEEPKPEEKPAEPEEVPAEEISEDAKEDEQDLTQILIYSAIGVVNLLIILVVYLIYRKLFKKKAPLEEEESILDGPADDSEFTEPPMDEMMVEDLDEKSEEPELDLMNDEAELDLNDLSEEPAAEPEPEPEPEPEVVLEETESEVEPEAIDLGEDIQDDALAEMLDEENEDQEEMPDFSLDDFGPEGLDDAEDNGEKKE